MRTGSVHIRKQQVLSSNLSVGSTSFFRSEPPFQTANLVADARHNAVALLTRPILVAQMGALLPHRLA